MHETHDKEREFQCTALHIFSLNGTDDDFVGGECQTTVVRLFMTGKRRS